MNRSRNVPPLGEATSDSTGQCSSALLVTTRPGSETSGMSSLGTGGSRVSLGKEDSRQETPEVSSVVWWCVAVGKERVGEGTSKDGETTGNSLLDMEAKKHQD